jgi:hypothetical protein
VADQHRHVEESAGVEGTMTKGRENFARVPVGIFPLVGIVGYP